MTLSKFLVVLLVACFAGCPAPVGSKLTVPKDAPATCAGFCRDFGMQLDSMVVMASNVGCVCAANAASARNGRAGGGMATILLQQQAQQSQQSPPPRSR